MKFALFLTIFFTALNVFSNESLVVIESPNRALVERVLVQKHTAGGPNFITSCSDNGKLWFLVLHQKSATGMMFYYHNHSIQLLTEVTFTAGHATPLLEVNGGQRNIDQVTIKYNSLKNMKFSLHHGIDLEAVLSQQSLINCSLVE